MRREHNGGGVRCPISVLLATLALIVVVSPFATGAQEPSKEQEQAEEEREADEQEQTDESNPFPWVVAGDFRLRFERTNNQEKGGLPDRLEPRKRGVVRFRLGVTKEFNELLGFGVRVTTGNPDDPNSTDVTLGNFLDDLNISLDRLYLGLTYKDFFLVGGKFPNPFLRTDLVWDGDVNPQGAAGSYRYAGYEIVVPKVSGIYFIVDEATIVERDSSMVGGQGEVLISPAPDWSLRFSAGYYDYDINSLIGATLGDIRGNRIIITPEGPQYVSDFNLFDTIAIVDYLGLGARYPIRFVGDYVKNFGNEDHESGLMLDLFVGPLSKKNDLRFRYGYAEAQTDAFLAAFSNDNTTYATNYVQHTVTVDYQAFENFLLNATYYVYRRLETTDPNPWITRLRLNAMVTW